VTGASGLLNSVADEMTAFAVTLVIGVTLIFVGFLTASAASDAPASRPPLGAVP
jgi:p-aminobenzoyl-glutamate transporter AbgT